MADADGRPELVPLDLLAQAEHGPDSVAYPRDCDDIVAARRRRPLEQLAAHWRRGRSRPGDARRSAGPSSSRAVRPACQVVDAIAAETSVSSAPMRTRSRPDQRGNAGPIFIGPWSAVAAGDYATGRTTSPTGAAARAYGGVVQVLRPVGRGTAGWPRGAGRPWAGRADRLAEGCFGPPARVRALAERAARATATAGEGPVDRSDPASRSAGVDRAYPAEASDDELADPLRRRSDRWFAGPEHPRRADRRWARRVTSTRRVLRVRRHGLSAPPGRARRSGVDPLDRSRCRRGRAHPAR